jgi:MFS transporter, PAT family, beta-lactamase induction signal transducer AmpG
LDTLLLNPIYLSRSTVARLVGFSICYLAQGVPVGLLSIALPAWLAARGVSAGEIATLIAVTGLPWGLKLIAGPFMDRFSFPPMGRRRPWAMAAQAGLVLSMLSLVAVTDPIAQFQMVLVIGFVINAFAAVQDVAVDGMAIDLLPENERGRANAFMAFGQVAGFSGFGALNGYLLVRFGMPVTAVVSTAAVAAVLLFITVAREREGERLLPWTEGEATLRPHEVGRSFAEIFRDLIRVMFLPMSLLMIGVEFLSRAAAGIGISIYPIIAVQELGYSAENYAYWIGLMGGLSAAVGLLFGPLIDRFGAARLLAFGLAGSGLIAVAFAAALPLWSNTSFVLGMLVANQIMNQMFFVAMIATFMGICWTKVAATQFAIYMSLANLSRSIGAGAFSLIAADVGSVGALYLMGGLLLGGAALLTLFDPASHRQRLGALQGA